jgi:hypothetical protein
MRTTRANPTSRRTTILADPELLARVDRLARTTGRTKTDILQAALLVYLDDAEDAVRTPLPFVGIGRSGHGRVSLDARKIAAREMGSGRP